MNRRAFLVTIAGGLLAAPLAVDAQPANRVWRIGFLGAASAARFKPFLEAVRLGLRDHGYVEGKNIAIEYRWAEGRYDRLPELAAELVRLNPDAINGDISPLHIAKLAEPLPERLNEIRCGTQRGGTEKADLPDLLRQLRLGGERRREEAAS